MRKKNLYRIALTAVLPVILFAAVSFCEEKFRYDPHGKRDPLVPLLGKEKQVILRLENITSAEDLRLEGIADGPKGRVAVLNGELVRANDRFGEITVKDIAKRAVTITIEGKEYVIKMPEEGGIQSGK